MRNLWKGGLAILGAIAISTVGVTEALAQARAWSPKPTQPAPYVNGMKPLTKLSDVLADKDPAESWRHKVVDDQNIKAAWVGLKPGDSMRTRLVADHRTAFIVWEGSVQVAAQGQTTFIATKGTMIQVPFRNTFTLTNVGATPSLHFEVFNAKRVVLYPQNSTSLPRPVRGNELKGDNAWQLNRLEAPDTYTRSGSTTSRSPSRNFFALPTSQDFVNDDRLYVNAVRNTSAANSEEYFQVSGGEAWFVMEGQMGFSAEGLDFITADPGDIVYIPEGRFHRPWHLGAGFSSGININGYPRGSHHRPETQPLVPPQD